MVGGSGRFDNTNFETENISTGEISESSSKGFVITPNIGYFIVDKFAVGLTPVFSYGESENNSIANYGIGSFARYYLLSIDKRINILTQLGYNIIQNNRTNSSGNQFLAKVGPAIFFNSSVAFEATLDYGINKNKSDFSNTTYTSFSISLGFQIHLEK